MARFVLGIGLILSAVAASCRPVPQQASATQSLDNFVAKAEGGPETVNVCGVPYSKFGDLPRHVRNMSNRGRIKGPKLLRREVLGTLAAAPIELLRPFVHAGGIIKVMKSVEAAEAACLKAPLSEAEQAVAQAKVQSCWLAAPTRIILPPSTAKIRSDLIRQLSYFFTEYFIDRAADGRAHGGAEEVAAFLTGFSDTRTALDKSFLEDIKIANPVAFEKLSKVLTPERRANFVYAEAIDGYYCSKSVATDSPRSVFKTRFPKAWATFTDKDAEHSPVRLFGE